MFADKDVIYRRTFAKEFPEVAVTQTDNDQKPLDADELAELRKPGGTVEAYRSTLKQDALREKGLQHVNNHTLLARLLHILVMLW